MAYEIKHKKGIIGTIVVIIVAIIILSYLGFDLKKIIASDMVQKNFAYLMDMLRSLWSNYLSRPFTFVWDEVCKPLFDLLWKAFKSGVQNIQDSNATSTK